MLAGLLAAGCLPLAVPGTAPPGSSDGSMAPGSFGPTGDRSPSPSGPVATVGPTPAPVRIVPAQGPLPAVPRAALAAELERLREQLGIPGVSVAIRWDDGRSWSGTSGVADVTTGVPVTRDTAFSLASVSKTYTAAVALRLVESGRLALDAPVAPLLPPLAFAVDPRVTVRMLLEHTSGLPDYFLNVRIDRPLQAEPDVLWSTDRALSFVPSRRTVPGTEYRYANTNYLLLGLVIEQVTGVPLAALVRALLLEPLGLEATWYQLAEPPAVARLARAHRLVGLGEAAVARVVAPASDVLPFRSVVSAAGGAGGIAATADDAARWMAALGRGDVLGGATYEEMTRGVRPGRAPADGRPYGLGVQLSRIAGRVAIGHSGRYLGFRSVVRYLPGERVAIAVLTNQSVVDPSRIATALLALVLPPWPQCTGCPEGR